MNTDGQLKERLMGLIKVQNETHAEIEKICKCFTWSELLDLGLKIQAIRSHYNQMQAMGIDWNLMKSKDFIENHVKLKEFAQKHLMPESQSTNTTHRRIAAFAKLSDVSNQLSHEEYQKCCKFINSDFDLSTL